MSHVSSTFLSLTLSFCARRALSRMLRCHRTAEASGPHVHLAIRGTVSRADLRQVIAATYQQVSWPPADIVRYDDGNLPLWHEPSGRYVDPATGEILPIWDDALDALGPNEKPLHGARFGPKFDAQGVLGGSKDAGRYIGYLTKYLTKQLAACHGAGTDAQAERVDRLVQALRYEPCSPAVGPGPWTPRDAGGSIDRPDERREAHRAGTEVSRWPPDGRIPAEAMGDVFATARRQGTAKGRSGTQRARKRGRAS
jgi:hypothetical protein